MLFVSVNIVLYVFKETTGFLFVRLLIGKESVFTGSKAKHCKFFLPGF